MGLAAVCDEEGSQSAASSHDGGEGNCPIHGCADERRDPRPGKHFTTAAPWHVIDSSGGDYGGWATINIVC